VPTPPSDLTDEAREFLTVRHLATLTTLRADGTPHVTPVGFTWDGTLARVICGGGSAKARNAARGESVAVCQVDGRFWLTLEGTARVTAEPDDVAEAVRRYAERYRQPRINPERVAIEITVTRVLGSPVFLGRPEIVRS